MNTNYTTTDSTAVLPSTTPTNAFNKGRRSVPRCGRSYQALILAVNHYVMTSDVIGEGLYLRNKLGQLSMHITVPPFYADDIVPLLGVLSTLPKQLGAKLERITHGSDGTPIPSYFHQWWYLHLPESPEVAETIAEHLVAAVPGTAECFEEARLAWNSLLGTPRNQPWEPEEYGVGSILG